MLKTYFNNFKAKWDIKSNWQLSRIMIVFALSGKTILFTMPHIKEYLKLPSDLNFLSSILFFIIISLPLYQIYLLFWAFLLGEVKFFSEFIKNTFKKAFKLFSFIKY